MITLVCDFCSDLIPENKVMGWCVCSDNEGCQYLLILVNLSMFLKVMWSEFVHLISSMLKV